MGIQGRAWLPAVSLKQERNRKELSFTISVLRASECFTQCYILLLISTFKRLRDFFLNSHKNYIPSHIDLFSLLLFTTQNHTAFWSLSVIKHCTSHTTLGRTAFPWKKYKHVVFVSFLFSSNSENKHFPPVLKFNSCCDSVMLWSFQPSIQSFI